MGKKFYRFRSIHSLITKFKELENQSIYFAHPSQLNDPMEGYRDFLWSGDYIAWTNLFKHYLLCTERLCSLLILAGEDYEISKENIPIFFGENDLPTPMYKELFNCITKTFFENKSLSTLIKKISERSTPIRRDELYFYLTAIHPLALETIYTEYEKTNLIPSRDNKNNQADSIIKNLIIKNFIGVLEKSLDENKREEKIADALFAAQRHSSSQIDIILRYNGSIDINKKNKNLVIVELPEEYISQLEKLVYPEWYTACFMSECKNSSVWGHYGANHTGACLIFNTDQHESNHYLNLRGINGWGSSGPIQGNIKLQLHPISYAKGFGKIDFFRSLGRLPISTLNSTWYGLDGKSSECANEIFNNEEEWQKNYWKNFYRDITIKSDDWEYEKEFRLILSSSLDSYSNPGDRSLTYDFSSLEGIIFGIKTSKNDKLSIIKIIEEKCKQAKRNDFKFYQAYYSPTSKLIEHTEMRLLKISL